MTTSREKRSAVQRIAIGMAAVLALAGLAACGSTDPSEAAQSTTSAEQTSTGETSVATGDEPSSEAPQETTSSEDPATKETSSATSEAAPDPSGLLDPSVKAAGKIVAAVVPTYAPYEFTDESGENIIGLVPDVLAEAGKRLGVDIEFETLTDFGMTVPGVQSSRYNIALIFDDTEEREAVVNVATFFERGMVAYGRTDSITKPEDLCGKRVPIGTVDATATQLPALAEKLCTSQGLPDFEYLPTSQSDQQIPMMQSGQIDWAGTDPGRASLILKSLGDGYGILSPLYFPSPTGVIVDKKLPGLAKALQATFQAMIDDGTMKDLMDKWDLGVIWVPEAKINGVGGAPVG